MSFEKILESYQKSKKEIKALIRKVGGIVSRVEQDTGFSLSGFDEYAFFNGDLSFNLCLENNSIVAGWIYKEPWEDWDHEATLVIPIPILYSGQDEVYSYYKKLLQEQEENYLMSEVHNVIGTLGFLKSNNVDLNLLLKAVEEDSAGLSNRKERQEFIEKLIRGGL